jgi:hypothetical protein
LKINRAHILRTAWTVYRTYARRAGYFQHNRALLAWCLREVWERKEALAAKDPSDPVEFFEAKVAHGIASVSYIPARSRVDQIEAELLVMQYSDGPTDWSLYSTLCAERERLNQASRSDPSQMLGLKLDPFRILH